MIRKELHGVMCSLGNELKNAGKLAEAEREFDKALRLFKDHPLALRGKAEARVAAGDIQGAIEICEKGTGLSGCGADAWRSLRADGAA